MAKITITKDLIKDLKKYGEQMSVGMASVVRDELTVSASSAIEAFYNDYSPTYYRRHYYNFMKKSFEKYYKNPHGGIVRGGVYLSPEGMDSIYQDPVEEVFDFVMHGFHGVSSGFESPKSFSVTPVMSPSPLDLIIENRNYIVSNIQKYAKFGYNRANSSLYSTFI